MLTEIVQVVNHDKPYKTDQPSNTPGVTRGEPIREQLPGKQARKGRALGRCYAKPCGLIPEDGCKSRNREGTILGECSFPEKECCFHFDREYQEGERLERNNAPMILGKHPLLKHYNDQSSGTLNERGIIRGEPILPESPGETRVLTRIRPGRAIGQCYASPCGFIRDDGYKSANRSDGTILGKYAFPEESCCFRFDREVEPLECPETVIMGPFPETPYVTSEYETPHVTSSTYQPELSNTPGTGIREQFPEAMRKEEPVGIGRCYASPYPIDRLIVEYRSAQRVPVLTSYCKCKQP